VRRQTTNLSIYIAILFSIAVGFQNCSELSNTDHGFLQDNKALKWPDTLMGGNGEPYGGKISYSYFVTLDLETTCYNKNGELVRQPLGVIRQNRETASFRLYFAECRIVNIRIADKDIIPEVRDSENGVLFSGMFFTEIKDREYLKNLLKRISENRNR
jgi:hypothetical protein